MNRQELWRRVLGWGCVAIFLLTPPALLTLQILDHLNERDVEVARSMSPMYMAVAGVMASLCGLNTWERKNGLNPKNHEQEQQERRQNDL